MATATKKDRNTTSVAPRARAVADSLSLEFFVYRTNGAGYRWEIVDERGESLAQSESFDSYDDAERAALRVHGGVASARFEPRHADVGEPEPV